MTTLEDATRAIRNGAVAGLVVAGLTTAVIVGVAVLAPEADGPIAAYGDPLNLIDVALMLGLTIGLWRRSRLCAVLLVVYYVSSQLLMRFETGNAGGLLPALVVLWFLGKGTVGTFVYHRLRRAEDPSYRAAPSWSWILAVPLGAGLLTLVALVVIGTTGLNTAVVTGAELAPKHLTKLHEGGVLQDGERLELFYSAAMFDVMADGNLLTDRRVISYEQIDGELSLWDATFDEVLETGWETRGSFFEDSMIWVLKTDGSTFRLLLSAENGGDERFVEALAAKLAARGEE